MAIEAKKTREGRLGIKGLGSLEAEIMAVVWDMKKATVRDVYEALRELKAKRQEKIAYTTVMTVMKRLADKKILLQDASSTAYIYTPKKSRDEIAGRMLDAIVDKLYGGNPGPLLQHLSGKPGKKR